jgi:hypothetical protein
MAYGASGSWGSTSITLRWYSFASSSFLQVEAEGGNRLQCGEIHWIVLENLLKLRNRAVAVHVIFGGFQSGNALLSQCRC